MFFSQQFGFRATHSTDHAILMIIDNLQNAIIDNNEFSYGVFFFSLVRPSIQLII